MADGVGLGQRIPFVSVRPVPFVLCLVAAGKRRVSAGRPSSSLVTQIGDKSLACGDPQSKGIVEHLVGLTKSDLVVPKDLTSGELVTANDAARARCDDVYVLSENPGPCARKRKRRQPYLCSTRNM